MRRSKLDAYKKELLDADVPESICRVVTDLIHSGENDEETSFTSLIDVLNELQDIIADRPHILFYQPDIPSVGKNTDEVKIDFGNVVYGREVESNRILELAALQTELFINRIILIGGNGGEGKTFMIEGVKNLLVERSGWVHLGVKFDRLMHNSPLSAIASAFERFFSSLFNKGDQEAYLSAISASLLQFLSPSMTVMLCNLIPSLRRLFPVIMQRVISDDDLTDLAKDSDAAEQNQFDEILSDLESSRNRLHYSIRRLVHAISSLGRPLLFVLDDLQWAGRASCEIN
jgi:predicted ATPase